MALASPGGTAVAPLQLVMRLVVLLAAAGDAPDIEEAHQVSCAATHSSSHQCHHTLRAGSLPACWGLLPHAFTGSEGQSV